MLLFNLNENSYVDCIGFYAAVFDEKFVRIQTQPMPTERKTLLLDAFGALISALFLVLIQVFELNKGFSDRVMHMLAGIAIFFALYSFSGYFLAREKWRRALAIVLCANFLYSMLTVYLVFQHRAALSVVEAVYFPLEILVLWMVCVYEFRQLRDKPIEK